MIKKITFGIDKISIGYDDGRIKKTLSYNTSKVENRPAESFWQPKIALEAKLVELILRDNRQILIKTIDIKEKFNRKTKKSSYFCRFQYSLASPFLDTKILLAVKTDFIDSQDLGGEWHDFISVVKKYNQGGYRQSQELFSCVEKSENKNGEEIQK